MPSASFVQVGLPGAGPKLATGPTYTDEASNIVQQQVVILGEQYLVSGRAFGFAVSVGTANDHILELMAGSSLNVRIHRITWEQSGNATSAQVASVQVWRLSTAGTGGTSVPPVPMVPSDTVGATAMTLPSAKGTELKQIDQFAFIYRQAIATTGTQIDDFWEWERHPSMEPIFIPAGTANGIALKSISGVTGATVNVRIEFTESVY
jgi:hypothetical protein